MERRKFCNFDNELTTQQYHGVVTTSLSKHFQLCIMNKFWNESYFQSSPLYIRHL